MREEKIVCEGCRIRWGTIRRLEEDLERMRRSPRVYREEIPRIEQELQKKYAIVLNCRNFNHPDVMY